MLLKIIQLEEVPQRILKKLSNKLLKIFNPLLTEAEIEPPSEIPSKTYDTERKQYKTDKLLEHIEKTKKIPNKGKILAITPEDLYSKNLNFVFGQAQSPGKIAIISLKRLKPQFYDKEKNFKLFSERAEKEATHEIGHTFGLKHCKNPKCVMSFSNNITDVDKKEPYLCKKCRKTLEL